VASVAAAVNTVKPPSWSKRDSASSNQSLAAVLATGLHPLVQRVWQTAHTAQDSHAFVFVHLG